MDATARFVAIVAVAAFVTERIVAVIDYLINAVRASRTPATGAAQEPGQEWRKVAFFFIAALIAYAVVEFANLRLLKVLQVDVHPLVDFWLTWLVVVAGADRVRSMLGGGGGGGEASQDRSDTPVVHLQIDGGEVRELKRVQ